MMITTAVREMCKPCWLAHGYEECVGCTRSLPKDGASISLTGTPAPHLVVDLDKLPCLKNLENQSCCDYIFIADDGDGWVAPIEITSGSSKANSKIVKQLQAGADLVAKSIPPTLSPKFLPIFVGKRRRDELRALRKRRIGFRGQKPTVTICRHGRIAGEFK